MKTNLLQENLEKAWSHAVRAYNVAENTKRKDTMRSLSKIVTQLSQVLEYEITMNEEKSVD